MKTLLLTEQELINVINILVESQAGEDRRRFLQKKYGDKLSDEIFDRVIEVDPTPSNKYSQWIMQRVINKSIKEEELNEKLTEYLDLFENPRIRNKVSKKDIFQYKDVNALGDAVEQYKDMTTKKRTREKFGDDTEKIGLTMDMVSKMDFIKAIQKAGGEPYFTGGCVRDRVIGTTDRSDVRNSEDVDILVRGVPEDKLLTILLKHGTLVSDSDDGKTGEAFGVYKFMPRGMNVEQPIDIALPRIEKKIGSGYKGFEMTSDYRLSIEDDLKRRDFCMNAIIMDMDGNLVDYHGGIDDVEKRQIRYVNPKAFAEDPLRMLRGIRFASQFEYDFEPKTLELIRQNAEKILEIVPERVLKETEKIFKKGNPYVGAKAMRDTHVGRHIFKSEITDKNLERVKDISKLSEFILLYKDFKFDPKILKDQMKLPNDVMNEMLMILSTRDEFTSPLEARKVAANVINKGGGIHKSSLISTDFKRLIDHIIKRNLPTSEGDLKIGGKDLIELGYKGREIGNILRELFLKALNEEIPNDRDSLTRYVKNK